MGLSEPSTAPPPGDEEEDDDEGEEGSGGKDDEGAGPTNAPPRPPTDTSAEIAALPHVPYPENARYDGVEGVVRLWVVLDARGQVIREEPGSGLGEAARKALLEASFKPATHLGLGVGSAFEYVYRFELL